MDNDKERPVVLITGAAGGLGQAVARMFAAHGAALALTDANAARLATLGKELEPLVAPEGAGMDRIFLRAADLTHLEETKALARAVDATWGRIDVVLHLAGGFRAGRVHETPAETWEFLFSLNAQSVHHLAVAVVPIMERQRKGVIIHVASRAALHGEAGLGVYAAAKAAVMRLTESMAAELFDSGIRVNCVLPSILDTPANRKAMPDADPTKWVAPESLAQVLLFLSSQAARDISGAAIPVYGKA